jgi:hypothetical protein
MNYSMPFNVFFEYVFIKINNSFKNSIFQMDKSSIYFSIQIFLA